MTKIAWALAAAVLLGCGAQDEHRYDALLDGQDETRWDPVEDPAADPVVDTPTEEVPVDDCAERAQWIYLVDEGRNLVQFKPDELTFHPIGLLSCPMGGSDPSPFSMSVDRNATAWVLWTPSLTLGGPGELFEVSTVDASCTATTFVSNQEGFGLFGMGFASDAAGSSEETLYIAGGAPLSIGVGNAQFGWVEMALMDVSRLGEVPGWPELTGTGSGELWGFFPHTTPMVHRLDKSTGTVTHTYTVEVPSGLTEAWAFAFWGGDFYIFHKLFSDPSSHVYKLETDDGSTARVVTDSGYKIVGAGVSTCAPVLI